MSPRLTRAGEIGLCLLLIGEFLMLLYGFGGGGLYGSGGGGLL